jgi:hypothetical protein
MPQFARPIADFENVGGFTTNTGGTTDLYTTIDEVVADNADYVVSPTNPAGTELYRISLNAVTDPGSDEGHILRYRIAKSAGGGRSINVDMRLRQQDGTVIASWSHIDVQATIINGAQTLTTGEAALITDYSTLVIGFDPSGAGGGAGREVYLYWAELEVPTPMTVVTVSDEPTFGITEAQTPVDAAPHTATVELWENGAFKQTLGEIDLSAGGTGALYNFWWDAATLTDVSGTNVELRIVSDASFDLDSVEWNRARALAEEVDKAGSDTVTFAIADSSTLVKLDAARESWNSILM